MDDASSGMLFTIGYQSTTVACLVRALAASRVAVLADVRAIPQSRKLGFSKHGLAATLAAAGIEYAHFRALGTPKEGRIAARHGDVATLARVYADHLAGDAPQAALADLAERAADRPTCLLCFERDHRICHRAIIAERLAATRPLTIVHLSPDLVSPDLPAPDLPAPDLPAG